MSRARVLVARQSEAGAGELLAARGIDVTIERVDRAGPFRNTAASAAQVTKQKLNLRDRVQAVVLAHQAGVFEADPLPPGGRD